MLSPTSLEENPSYEKVASAKELRDEDHIILLLGLSGSGKTNFLNKLVGRREDSISKSLQASNRGVEAYRVRNPSYKHMSLAYFVILDTPGLDSDADVLKLIEHWLSKGRDHPLHVAAIMYLHRMLDIRPAATLNEKLRKIIKTNGLRDRGAGSGVEERMILVETHWDVVERKKGEERHRLLDHVTQQVFANATSTSGGSQMAGRKETSLVKFDNTKSGAWSLISEALSRYGVMVKGRNPFRARSIDALQLYHCSPKTLEEFLTGSYTVEVKGEPQIDDVVIVVLGPTGSGKSSFITAAAGEGDIGIVGDSLRSCTQEVNAVRLVPGEPSFPSISFIDTPGFNDTEALDAVILERLSEWLRCRFKENIPIAGVLYFHRITDNRMSASAVNNLNIFYNLCGKQMMDRAVFVTTMWDEQNPEESTMREGELRRKFWKQCLDKGARVLKFDGSRQGAFDIILPLISEKNSRIASTLEDFIMDGSVRLQREVVLKEFTLRQTGAGQAVFDKLASNVSALEAEISRLEDEVKKGGSDGEGPTSQEKLAERRATLNSLKDTKAKLEMSTMEKFKTKTKQFLKNS